MRIIFKIIFLEELLLLFSILRFYMQSVWYR